MGIRLQLILTACVVCLGLTFVQPQNQAITDKVNDGSEIQGNFQDSLHSIAKNDLRESRISFQILQQGLSRERRVFNSMRKELHTAQNVNANKKRHMTIKRETNQTLQNEITDIQGRAITGSYIDKEGFYREAPEVENFRYDRVHIYRGLLICAQERLTLCRAFLQDVIIDWEILRDDGIVAKNFDTLCDKLEKRLNEEIESVDKIMLVNPRTAKIIQPVNQSSIDEISNQFGGLINCLEEQKPEQYARDRFEDMISRAKICNCELIDTFYNVTTAIADIKRKYNV